MKKFLWMTAFAAALTMFFAGCSNPASNGPSGGGNIDLGAPTIENSGSYKDQQKGWATNGTDGVSTSLTIDELKNAQFLKLGLNQKPSGEVQIIWQGNGDNWNWNQTTIINDDGVPDATKGAVWDDAAKTLTIELPKALAGYNALKSSTQAKFFIAYYKPDFNALGLVTAELISSPPVSYVDVTFNAGDGTWDIGTADNPELVSTQKIKLEKGQSAGSKFPPNPSKPGFYLEKWVDSAGNVYTADTEINATVTLNAVWAAGEAQKWTVTFNTADGTPATIPSIQVSDGTAIGPADFPANPTKSGSIFIGWFDSGNVEYTSAKAITGNVDLTAGWNPIVLTGYIWVRDLTIDGDIGGGAADTLANQAIGKGNVKGDDFTAIKNAETGSAVYLALTCSQTGKENWGAGTFGGAEFKVPASYTVGTTFFVKLSVSDILTGLEADAAQVFVNVYGNDGYVIQKAQLWKPDPDVSAELVIDNPVFTKVWTEGSTTIGSDGWIVWSGEQAAIGYVFPDGSAAYSKISISFEFKDVVVQSSGSCEIIVKSIADKSAMYNLSDISGDGNKYPWIGPNAENSAATTASLTYSLDAFGQGIGFQYNKNGWAYSVKITRIKFHNE